MYPIQIFARSGHSDYNSALVFSDGRRARHSSETASMSGENNESLMAGATTKQDEEDLPLPVPPEKISRVKLYTMVGFMIVLGCGNFILLKVRHPMCLHSNMLCPRTRRLVLHPYMLFLHPLLLRVHAVSAPKHAVSAPTSTANSAAITSSAFHLLLPLPPAASSAAASPMTLSPAAGPLSPMLRACSISLGSIRTPLPRPSQLCPAEVQLSRGGCRSATPLIHRGFPSLSIRSVPLLVPTSSREVTASSCEVTTSSHEVMVNYCA